MLICLHVIINRGYNCLDLTAQFAVIANLKDKNSAIAQFAEFANLTNGQKRCNDSIIVRESKNDL